MNGEEPAIAPMRRRKKEFKRFTKYKVLFTILSFSVIFYSIFTDPGAWTFFFFALFFLLLIIGEYTRAKKTGIIYNFSFLLSFGYVDRESEPEKFDLIQFQIFAMLIVSIVLFVIAVLYIFAQQ